jgi:hypothetical protein
MLSVCRIHHTTTVPNPQTIAIVRFQDTGKVALALTNVNTMAADRNVSKRGMSLRSYAKTRVRVADSGGRGVGRRFASARSAPGRSTERRVLVSSGVAARSSRPL